MTKHNLKPWQAFRHHEARGKNWIAYGESQTGRRNPLRPSSSGHVGDSRLYQIDKTNCQQITSDQRVHNTLYTAGQLAESEGNARGDDLEQALGLEEEHHPLKM